MIEKVGLTESVQLYPLQLTASQIQRVAMAVALVTEPEILILDEPTSNLDSVNALELMQLLKNMNEKGTTIIMSMQDSTFEDFATSKVYMKNGRITQRQYHLEDVESIDSIEDLDKLLLKKYKEISWIWEETRH